MFDFILYQWIMKEFTSTNIANCVTKGYITQEQADVILATSQATE